MNIISIENLTKAYGSKVLFQDVSLGINSGDKIGFIGRNGKGKTTFLKIIAGIEEMDSGEIIKGSKIKIEYLPQNVEFKAGVRVLDQVFRGNSENMKTLREYEKALTEDEIDNEKIMKLTEKMDRDNVWELESEAKAVLTKLGIVEFNKPIESLSGGQKRRVALASALINDADLLILDEPTNHLDNNTIEWLEEFLKSRKGALLMVTHDRYFLDRVTNRIVELENANLYSYDGSYNYYIGKKAEREEREMATERKRRSLYKQELAWMKQGIKARGTRQKARVERFEELKDSKLNLDSDNIEISVGGQRLGKKIIEAKNISKSYGSKEVIRDFSYIVLRDDRIGILGENGAGKTSLMNILTGKLEPSSGSIEIGETVKIGYFSQEALEMDISLRAIDYIKEAGEYIETGDGSRITASQMMERFLFTGKEQYTPIEKLSGGERRRLFLLRVLMSGPNVLVLDEPTNDLDISTLTILEDYINDFNGPVLVVSHDRYLLDKLVEKIFHIEAGLVKEYPGNYSLYRERLQREEELCENLVEKEEIKPENKFKKNRELKFSYNEKREWESIDGEIMDLENKLEDLDKEMIRFATDYTRLQELMEEKSLVEKELEEKMDRWVYLSELKEKIDRQ